MVKSKKEDKVEKIETQAIEEQKTVSPNDLEWTDHVLNLLSEDEKIKGNPTTDGLRRIFEIALNCRVMASTTQVVQSPDPNNEKRATVVHSLTYLLNAGVPEQPELNTITVDGAADVYWGNCDKIYRNHPVAVAETRAEGRALRRALKLRKVVAAEEITENIEDHPDRDSVSRITNHQINFIDVLAQRLDIDVLKLFKLNELDTSNVYNTLHEQGVGIIRTLSRYQQNVSEIPSNIIGYSSEWK
jgi:hypothetical protein